MSGPFAEVRDDPDYRGLVPEVALTPLACSSDRIVATYTIDSFGPLPAAAGFRPAR
jgi:hypothetical protein